MAHFEARSRLHVHSVSPQSLCVAVNNRIFPIAAACFCNGLSQYFVSFCHFSSRLNTLHELLYLAVSIFVMPQKWHCYYGDINPFFVLYRVYVYGDILAHEQVIDCFCSCRSQWNHRLIRIYQTRICESSLNPIIYRRYLLVAWGLRYHHHHHHQSNIYNAPITK